MRDGRTFREKRFDAVTVRRYDYANDAAGGRTMVKYNEMAMQTLSDLPTNMPVARVEFDYDYMSRRVGKTVYEWGSNGWQEVSSATFLYDAWNLIAEQTSAETNFFTFGLDLSGTLQGAGGVGGLVSAVLGTNAVCYTYDGNGNVSELINCAGGAILSHYEYSPFGETIVATGELAKSNPFRFSSKYTDDETTLVYYGYRYYSPSISKWLSNDPLMDIGSSVTMAAKWQLLKMLEVYARVAEALMFNEELPDDIRVMALLKLLEISDISRSLMGNEPVFWLSKANNNWALFCANNPVNRTDPWGLAWITVNVNDRTSGSGSSGSAGSNTGHGWTTITYDNGTSVTIGNYPGGPRNDAARQPTASQ